MTKNLALAKAFQLSTELVSAVLVATIIGFILDNWFDTKPWLIIIFFYWCGGRYYECYQISKKNAERLDKNGSKSNDSIQRLQNWARNKNW